MSHVMRLDMTGERGHSIDARWGGGGGGSGARRETAGDGGGGIEKVPSCRITHPQSHRAESAIVTATCVRPFLDIGLLRLIADPSRGQSLSP